MYMYVISLSICIIDLINIICLCLYPSTYSCTCISKHFVLALSYNVRIVLITILALVTIRSMGAFSLVLLCLIVEDVVCLMKRGLAEGEFLIPTVPPACNGD